MIISKPLLLLFSFLLFFCLFTKQADYISNIYCDVAETGDVCQALSDSDGTQLEADDQLEFNEPFILPVFMPYSPLLLPVFSVSAEDRYIPPQLTHFLRPPLD